MVVAEFLKRLLLLPVVQGPALVLNPGHGRGVLATIKLYWCPLAAPHPASFTKERILQAMNRRDLDNRLIRKPHRQCCPIDEGILPDYDAQAMVSPIAGSLGNGMLITAA